MYSRYFFIFLLIVSLLVAFYFVRSTFYLYSAKSTLGNAESNLNKLKNENDTLKKEILYRKTDQYVINEAREKLNYGFEGESILIVPKDVTKQLELPVNSTESNNKGLSSTKSKIPESAFKMWLDVFF